ncbi:MAG: hypothetical protein WC516_07460 [Patescibacteria group bacterium]
MSRPDFNTRLLGNLIRQALDVCPGLSGNPQPDRVRAGYFTLMDSETGEVVSVSPFGDIPPEKEERYRSFSEEKARRLWEHKDEHDSSWESRNPAQDKWGGAINAHDFILAFSGLPELLDEAISTIVAYQMGWLSWKEAEFITSKSNNGFIEKLRDALCLA